MLESLLEEQLLLDQEFSLACSCAHAVNSVAPVQPGKHFLSAALVNAHGFTPCLGDAAWLCIEPDSRAGKAPFYLCDECASYWMSAPFELIGEPLK